MTCRRVPFASADTHKGVLWSWPHERERVQREVPAESDTVVWDRHSGEVPADERTIQRNTVPAVDLSPDLSPVEWSDPRLRPGWNDGYGRWAVIPAKHVVRDLDRDHRRRRHGEIIAGMHRRRLARITPWLLVALGLLSIALRYA